MLYIFFLKYIYIVLLLFSVSLIFWEIRYSNARAVLRYRSFWKVPKNPPYIYLTSNHDIRTIVLISLDIPSNRDY